MAAEQILVVDGTPIGLRFTELLLAHAGYQVRTASDGGQALALMQSFSPDLIVTDLMMPGVDGFELARRVKADPGKSDTVVVALTASAVDQHRALEAGCDSCLNRHTESAAMIARIREFLDERAARRNGAPADSAELRDPGRMELRNTFLAEGLEGVQTFLDQADPGVDVRRLGECVDGWVGSAGMPGCTRVSETARSVASLLRLQPLRTGDLRAQLGALATAFSEALGMPEPPLPRHISATLDGKRVALVGIAGEEADRFCEALAKVQARPLVFDFAERPDSRSVAECDLVVVQVRPETWDSPWFPVSRISEPKRGVVFAGKPGDLRALGQARLDAADDFVVEPFETEEALMRLAAVLSRRTSAPPREVAALSSRPQAASLPEPGKAPAVAARPNIVVADDDMVVSAVVRTALQNYGMKCHVTDNGRDALRMIREQKPRAAVLDINMPEMDGFETLTAIRSEGLDLPVMLLSAREQADDVLRGFRLGADDYMVKPFNPFELVARLKRLV